MLILVVTMFRMSGGHLTVSLVISGLIAYGLVAALYGWLALKIMAGRNWARFVLLAAILYSALTLPGQVGAAFNRSMIEGALLIAGYILYFLSVILVFLPASNLWFRHMSGTSASVA